MSTPPTPEPEPKPRRGGPRPKYGHETPITRTFSILPSQLEYLTQLGDGNRSEGLRRVTSAHRVRP